MMSNKLTASINFCCFLLLFISFWITMSLSEFTRNAAEDENVPIDTTEAVQGKTGQLPCNITSSIDGDKVVLVLWYKEEDGTAIYSYDTRGGHDDQPPFHWIDEFKLGKRAFFQVSVSPAMLTIDDIKTTDIGIYRCRVDFHKQPTRNSRVKLQVIVPPEKLLVLDSDEETVPHYILGPYNEGSTINITCISIGGRPLPNVTWWHENTSLNDVSVQILSEKRIKSVLQLKKLSRQHLHMVFTCQASNNNVTNPLGRSVTLDMNLKPLWVKLQGQNKPLSADNLYQLQCETAGSRPVPSITWWKGSNPMRNTREIISPDGNITTSILSFTPTIDDRGKFLSCRAEQLLIPDSGIEDGWKLDIFHIPVVTLEFGTNLNTTTIREGADVYFECNIKSNPFVYKISWRHNDKVLENNLPEGIIITNQSLVLQNVSRARSGLYTCIGSNREGDGTSNSANLDIKFAPICRQGQKILYSTGRHETIKIICEVDANPYDIIFTWKFNTTETEFIDLPASLLSVDKIKSTAHYTPMTENDYGTLLCWGSNEIGMQIDPCIYTIIPSGKPDPLTNCTVLNQTYNGFQIECIQGFDGGLQQEYIIEVYTVGDRQHPIIKKSIKPYFELTNLNSGVEYNVFIMAQNLRGRSNSTYLLVYTLKNPEKQTDLLFATDIVGGGGVSAGGVPTIVNLRPFLIILIGCVAVMMFIAIIIVFIVRIRGSTGRDRNNCENYTINSQRNVIISSQDIGMIRDLCIESIDNIDKNPDIIPQASKIDDKDDDEKCFEWINSKNTNMYATAAVAEQNSINSSITSYNSSYSHGLASDILSGLSGNSNNNNNNNNNNEKQHQQQQLKQHTFSGLQQQRQHQQQQQLHLQSTFNTNYHTMIPYNKYNHLKDLRYAEISPMASTSPLVMPSTGQRFQFVSSTLGRPRINQLKTSYESTNICAQIDLAHPHPKTTGMHSMSPMYVNSDNITGVTMSHPSHKITTTTALPPPPLFANNPPTSASVSTTITTTSLPSPNYLLNGSSINTAGATTASISIPPVDFSNETITSTLLQTVPEHSVVNTVNSNRMNIDDRVINNGTRF